MSFFCAGPATGSEASEPFSEPSAAARRPLGQVWVNVNNKPELTVTQTLDAGREEKKGKKKKQQKACC